MTDEAVVNQEEQISKLGITQAAERKKFRHYVLFFSGQQFSILGSSIVSFVLIWWITEITQSELMLGLASLVSLGPFLLVTPFSGVIADKANKKMLLLIVDAMQAMFTVILTIVFMIYYTPGSTDNQTLLITSIFITLGLRGTMQAFHSPVVSTLVPTMVPAKHYSRMNGISYLISGVIQVIGPILGALFLGWFGVSLTMWIDLVTFGIAVIPLIFITIPALKKESDVKREKFGQQFKEGIRTIRDIKGFVPLMITVTLINFFFVPIGTLMPLFINKVHSGTKENYALVMGLLQAGIILGGLFMVFFKGFKNKIRTAIICVFILFLGEALLIVVPTDLNARFWLIGIIMLITIFPNPLANVSFTTSMQLMIPKEKMGRVSSVLGFFSMAISPIAMFLSGLIGEFVPIGIVFTTSALLGIISTAFLYFLTPARNLDKEIKKKIQELAEAEKLQELEDAKEDPLVDIEGSERAIPMITFKEEPIISEATSSK